MRTPNSIYIAIIMEGGVIQNVCTNDDTIDVVVVDYDAFEGGDPPVWEEAPELMTIPLSDSYHADGEPSSWKETEVSTALKQLGY